jgi:hypothetical protein
MSAGSTGCSLRSTGLTHECLASREARKLVAVEVINVVSELLSCAGRPATFVPTQGQSSCVSVDLDTRTPDDFAVGLT